MLSSGHAEHVAGTGGPSPRSQSLARSLQGKNGMLLDLAGELFWCVHIEPLAKRDRRVCRV
jgi:hypothetical protein